MGYYLEDRLRTQTFVMLTDVNMNFYTPRDQAIFLNLKNPIVYQSFKYRIGESDVFLGAGYLYTLSEIKLNREEDESIIDRQDSKITSSALGLILDYDTRDNALSPNKGMLLTPVQIFLQRL